MTGHDRTSHTLASALPRGIRHTDNYFNNRSWSAQEIATYQAEQLAESGYVLLRPESVDEATIERPCTACGLTAEDGYGPDPCLGWLDGVDGACCGHGRPPTRACVRSPRSTHSSLVSLALVVVAVAWACGLIWWGVL